MVKIKQERVVAKRKNKRLLCMLQYTCVFVCVCVCVCIQASVCGAKSDMRCSSLCVDIIISRVIVLSKCMSAYAIYRFRLSVRTATQTAHTAASWIEREDLVIAVFDAMYIARVYVRAR